MEIIDWKLSGSGVAHARCGTYYLVGCLNTHLHNENRFIDDVEGQLNLYGQFKKHQKYVEVHRHHCDRQDCPVCYHKWASRRAKEAEWRLQHYVIRGRSLRPVHAVVSLPEKDYDKPLKEMRKKAYSALKSCHVHGGVLIFHPKRQRCVMCHSRKPYKENQCKCGCVDFEWYYSPHFHAIVYGWISHTDDFYKKTGYVVVNLGVRRSVRDTIFYQLTHAGYMKGRSALTWFGSLSYNKLNVPLMPKVEHNCPFCDSKLKKLVLLDGCKALDLPKVDGFSYYGVLDGYVYESDVKNDNI